MRSSLSALTGLMFLSLADRFQGRSAAILVMVYFAFFAACVGPVWTLVQEIFPNAPKGRP
jgi:hypothetical protein